jgi:5'(3')-deoxyribonucleotidase
MVNHPPHYTQGGGIECIVAIEAALSPEEWRGFLKGQVLKYTWRERHKGGREDCEKAQWYLKRLLATKGAAIERPIIFLDMDGVCCDFASAAAAACHHAGEAITQWNMARQFGITDEEFWRAVDAGSEDFWANLRAYPWFPAIHEALKEQGSVYITTTPSQSPRSFAGKTRWLHGYFGRDFRDFIFTPHKHLLAAPGRVLIDDNAEMCKRFEEHGGRAILFPQPWNDAPPESFGPPWKI